MIPPPSSTPGLTLEALAEAKKLPVDFLRNTFNCETVHRNGIPAVKVPYFNETGTVVAARFRLALEGAGRFAWRHGDHALPYGLHRLHEIHTAGWVLLVEGESDVWTATHHFGIPVLGIPGKGTWRSEWARYLAKLFEVVLWQEPDASDLTDRVVRDIPNLRVILNPPYKDISAAHVAGENVHSLITRLRSEAVLAADIVKKRQETVIGQLAWKVSPILEAPDPLAFIKDALKVGYGGEVWRPLVVYLAATSRVLVMRPGAMPVHLLLLGESAAGKNYTLNTALRLFPKAAVYKIDAGSPRVFIYDDMDTRHGVVVFGEADSLPAGEDNPAASAVRALLSENAMRYKVTMKDPATGNFTVREIVREGPTVLLTTSTRRLGHQMMTRLFSLDIPDDPAYIKQVLRTQAEIEVEGGIAPPDETLVALQEYLQEQAPWDVFVAFAPALAREIGKQAALQSRLTRDHARLLALIKSVAILRHVHRDRDDKGRLIATLDDYATVYDLLNPVYKVTITGISEGVRHVVQAVTELREEGVQPVTIGKVASKLGIAKNVASYRVKSALKGEFLRNETEKGYDLVLGTPLPDKEAGLPTPESLQDEEGPPDPPVNAATPERRKDPMDTRITLEDLLWTSPETPESDSETSDGEAVEKLPFDEDSGAALTCEECGGDVPPFLRHLRLCESCRNQKVTANLAKASTRQKS